MKIIIGGRWSGKTYRLIQESLATGYPIIVANKLHKKVVFDVVNKNKFASIPIVFTVTEFLDRYYLSDQYSKVLIDDLENVLYSVFSFPVLLVSSTPTEGLEVITNPLEDQLKFLQNFQYNETKEEDQNG